MEVREGGTPAPRFSERMLRLLNSVESRFAGAPAEKEALQRILYKAKGHGSIGPSAVDVLADSSQAPKARVTTTRIDGELATTMRIDVAEDEYDTLPALDAFSDVVAPHLRSGRVVLEFSQVDMGFDFSKSFPELPFVALRPAWLAARYFQADFVIATISVAHQAFYRRVFGFAPWCEPRQRPNSDCAIACIGLDFLANRERLEARYPFLCSTRTERNALFTERSDKF
jgi:hypothetical protein